MKLSLPRIVQIQHLKATKYWTEVRKYYQVGQVHALCLGGSCSPNT